MSYTYLIGWSELNTWYYGARWAKNSNPDDLWVLYFTSSKDVKRFREEYGEPNVVQVRRTFQDNHSCRKWEETVIRRIKSFSNQIWLNRRAGNTKWFTEGPLSDEHKQKLSESKRGKSLKRTKKPVRKKWSDEHKKKLSVTMTGMKRPKFDQDRKQLCSEHSRSRIWANDGTKSYFLKPDDPRLDYLQRGRIYSRNHLPI